MKHATIIERVLEFAFVLTTNKVHRVNLYLALKRKKRERERERKREEAREKEGR